MTQSGEGEQGDQVLRRWQGGLMLEISDCVGVEMDFTCPSQLCDQENLSWIVLELYG